MFADRENVGELVAKIADFCYSITAASVKLGKGAGGTPHFLPPECADTATAEMKKYANKPSRDNYSFGLVVWQVAMNGETPYIDMDEDDIRQIKNSDRELTTLMNQLPVGTPDTSSP